MQNKDDIRDFRFADLKSVYIKFEIEIKSFGFFLLNTFSILFVSYLLQFSLLNAVLIIVLANRLWFREGGFHASNLINCFIITNVLFIFFIWLSCILSIPPIITLILCAVFHENLEQAYLLAVVLAVSFLKVEYNYLSTVLCLSLILAYITNGQGIHNGVISYIDKKLCKLTEYNREE